MVKLEYVPEGDWHAVDRLRTTLQSLVLDTGGRNLGIRIGTSSVTFTASGFSAATTVAHGLGRTPIVVLALPNDSQIHLGTNTYTATSFNVAGTRSLGAVSLTFTLGWVAIG